MTFKPTTAIAALLLAVPTLAIAEADEDTLIVNDELEMVTKAAAPAHLADDLDEVISGWHFRSDETQSLQMDDFDNPGLLAVELAIDAWKPLKAPPKNPVHPATAMWKKAWPACARFIPSGTKRPAKCGPWKCRSTTAA